MKTLYLLRHAAAEQNAPAPFTDHERALSPEGEAEAGAVGEYLRALPFPAQVLSSSSVRTLQTVRAVYGRILKDEGQKVFSHFDRKLYLAPADLLLDAIRATDDINDVLLVAAHNPGVAELAHILSRGALADHTQDFVPATLAVFSVDAKSWGDVAPGAVALKDVFTPGGP